MPGRKCVCSGPTAACLCHPTPPRPRPMRRCPSRASVFSPCSGLAPDTQRVFSTARPMVIKGVLWSVLVSRYLGSPGGILSTSLGCPELRGGSHPTSRHPTSPPCPRLVHLSSTLLFLAYRPCSEGVWVDAGVLGAGGGRTRQSWGESMVGGGSESSAHLHRVLATPLEGQARGVDLCESVPSWTDCAKFSSDP